MDFHRFNQRVFQQNRPLGDILHCRKTESFLPIADARVAPSINKCLALMGGYNPLAVAQARRAAHPSAVASPGGAVSCARTSSASSMT